MVETATDLTLVQKIDTGEPTASPSRRTTPTLLEEVNAMLDEAFKDGTYAEIYEKWIGEPYTGDTGQ